MNRSKRFADEYQKPVDLIVVLMKYLSFWKWFLFSLFFFVACAVVYLKFTLPVYNVSTSILLKDDQRGGGTSELNAFKELGLFTKRNNVDNELEVLQKSILMQQVVKELGIYADYTQLGTFGFLRSVGIDPLRTKGGTFAEKQIYGKECPVLVSLPDVVLDSMTRAITFNILVRHYGEYEFFGEYNDKAYTVKASISDNTVRLPFGQLMLKRGEFRPSKDMLLKVVMQNPLSKAEQYMGQLTMELTSMTTSTVDITMESGNVQLGKDFLRKLIEVYNREDMNDQVALATKTAQFIDERLMSLSKELGAVESKVENYKQVQGITDIQTQTEMFIQQTGDFNQKRLDLETQLAIVSDMDDYIHKRQNRYQPLPASTGIKSEALNELINNYNKLLLQYNRLSRIASNNNQAMIDLNNQIESLFTTVQSSVRNEKNNLQIAQRDLLSKNSENAARIRAIPRQEREYTEIKRQQGIKEALFLFLLQKKEEKYLNLSLIEPVAKLIDNVRASGSPVWPVSNLILMLSVLGGFVVPVIGVKLRDMLRYQIETKKELEELSNVPVLGELPRTEGKGVSIIKENSTDSFTEYVRLLRSNLLFVLDSSEKKVINIVSSVSGEGKTFVSINLAMSLALLDKKVLIIGLDIRKPKLAEYLKINNDPGITLFLTGQLRKEKLVQPSGIHPNLWVVTAGPVPPNPNELLAKPELDKLIDELRQHYDYVLVDSAPIGVVSDSFALNRFSDVNLYVVRADFTHKRNVEDATDLYRQKKLKNLYFILNGTDSRKVSYSYGSAKKYRYGYGYEKNKSKS